MEKLEAEQKQKDSLRVGSEENPWHLYGGLTMTFPAKAGASVKMHANSKDNTEAKYKTRVLNGKEDSWGKIGEQSLHPIHKSWLCNLQFGD